MKPKANSMHVYHCAQLSYITAQNSSDNLPF